MRNINFYKEDFKGKRVIIREDFNVPIIDGAITDTNRIQASIPTITHLLESDAKIGIISHLGRPKGPDESFSLKVVADELEKELNFPVRLINNDFQHQLSSDYISLYENIRFLEGETENSPLLAKKIASSCDIYIMDAFATCHRAHASTSGAIEYAKRKIAGPLLVKELSAIEAATNSPAKPVVAIIGGAKISSKLPLLTELVKWVDKLIIGGGMANTCLKAQGYEIGNSLYEESMIASAKTLLETSNNVVLPNDAITAKSLGEDIEGVVTNIHNIESDDVIGDIGPETIKTYSDIIENAGTIIWNGPVGIFEKRPFQKGTQELSYAVAESNAYSLAGGGDTIAAINQFAIGSKISYISTGGGAFLAYLQSKDLPGIINLEQEYSK